jgi:hypothetical protein
MFLPSSFYDECDQQGILVYHDMQYAQQGHAPLKTTIQEDELRHNVRRLASHASIVMWDGCNECHVVLNTTTGIYATFVMTVVAEEDGSRALWPSCPASGWTGGVDRLTSIPNGKVLTTPVGGPRFETHGPYQHGSGFPQVNGPSALTPFPPNVPISVQGNKGIETGIAQANVFASEFGCVVMSSFEVRTTTTTTTTTLSMLLRLVVWWFLFLVLTVFFLLGNVFFFHLLSYLPYLPYLLSLSSSFFFFLLPSSSFFFLLLPSSFFFFLLLPSSSLCR